MINSSCGKHEYYNGVCIYCDFIEGEEDSAVIIKMKELFKDYDHKLGQAIKQNKLPMVSYYYARLTALFDVAGRTKDNKNSCPNWCAWNKFSRMMKKGDFLI